MKKTGFVVREPGPGGSWFTWFDLEECETCGTLIQAPNAVKVDRVPAGAVEVAVLPPEGQWSDERGAEVCERCGS